MKRLYRSEENRIIFGIMGGLGEYFEVDPALLRLGFLFLLLATAVLPGTLAYLAAVLVVPRKP